MKLMYFALNVNIAVYISLQLSKFYKYHIMKSAAFPITSGNTAPFRVVLQINCHSIFSKYSSTSS